MKLHRALVEAVAEAVAEIFLEGRYADKVIERLLKSNPRWGSRDRAFIAENTYELVRWWRLVWELGIGDWQQGKALDVADMFKMVGVNLVLKASKVKPDEQFLLPVWQEFEGLRTAAILERYRALSNDRKTIQSIPDWLDELGFAELGEKWAPELAVLNQPSALVIRANTLKTNIQHLQELLAKDGWDSDFTPLSPDALVMRRRGNVFQNHAFQEGLFEVQDAGSQCIAPFLQVEAGMRVVDACAGAGGKSLHMAALMQNKGSIISLDTEAWKLEELRKRARRSGAHIIQARPIESSKTIKRLQGTADRLLLDVPCSGLGTLRRNPDAKWKLSAAFMDTVRNTQAEILRNYSKILKPGGQLVYATCSILPSENEQQVERFLSENPSFVLLEDRKVSPLEQGFDGFYMARMALG